MALILFALILIAVGWALGSYLLLGLTFIVMLFVVVSYLRQQHVLSSSPGQLPDEELANISVGHFPDHHKTGADEATDRLITGQEGREDFVPHLARSEH